MTRTMTKLIIATAMMLAAAGSPPPLTTTGDSGTPPDLKALATTRSAPTDEQQTGEKAPTFERFNPPSRRPSNGPVILVAPSFSEGCGKYLSPWQQIQLYISVFSWL
ncbi:MAG TPA: hypothetical protein VH640_31655 [Bryobacteraceae bacterium]|jgi:hypothetical protein